MGKLPIQQNPETIDLDDFHLFKLEKDREMKVAPVRSRTFNRDVKILRQVQLEMMKRGDWGKFVNIKYMARVTGRHPKYIQYVFIRLAKAGLVERYFRPYRTMSDGIKNIDHRRLYYWLGRAKNHVT